MKKLALLLAVVLLIGCATGITPGVTMVHEIRVGYTDITDKEALKNLTPKDVVLSTNLPHGTKTVVCVVFLSCKKGTPLHIVWWSGDEISAAFDMKVPQNCIGTALPLWYTQPYGLLSGEWKFEVSLSGEHSRSVKFTIQ